MAWRLATVVVSAALSASMAHGALSYQTKFGPTAESDFSTLLNVGQHGSVDPASANRSFDWTSGLKMASKWGNAATIVLTTSGTADNGAYADTYAAVDFTLNTGGDLSKLRFGMSTRQIVKASPAVNTYPQYRVEFENGTLTLLEHARYNSIRTLNSTSVTLDAANAYRLEMDAVGGGPTTDAQLAVRLFEGTTLIAQLSATDFAKAAAEETGTGHDWSDGGVDVHASGHIGVYAFSSDGTSRGINLSSFSVSPTPAPEPSTLAAAASLAAFAAMRRRRRAV